MFPDYEKIFTDYVQIEEIFFGTYSISLFNVCTFCLREKCQENVYDEKVTPAPIIFVQ